MNHIANYQKFNEEIRLKDAILAGGISLATSLGTGTTAQERQPISKNQQINKSIVSNNAYKSVELIESTFSFTDFATGRIIGASYDGRAKEAVMRKYIDETIGLSNWFKIGEMLRGQIYQYMFQHDSGSDKVVGAPDARRNWWLSGLAQAIDPSIVRTEVNEKPLNNPKVKVAIQTIVNAINNGTINNYYESYKKVLDSQYAGTKSASKDNYKNVWKYRPIAFERLMNGESWAEIKKDWFESIKGVQSVNQQQTKPTTLRQVEKPELIESPYLDTMYIKFKRFINNERQKNPGTKIRVIFKEFKIVDGELNLLFDYRLGSGFDTYSILFNEVGAKQEALDKAKLANSKLVLINTGTIRARANAQSNLKDYEFHLVGIDFD